MAYSKSFVIVILTWFFVGISHGVEVDKNTIAAVLNAGGGGVSAMPCVQKLMPCQPALAAHMKNPPATCCEPLKEMMTNDAQCLCTVFGDSKVMKSMNVSQDRALDFAKSCGAKPDLSLCKKASTPGSASAPAPSTASGTNSSNSSNKTASAPAQNTASVTSKFGGFVAVASLMSLVMLLAF